MKITITGPQGCGKSTLAMLIAQHLSDISRSSILFSEEPGHAEMFSPCEDQEFFDLQETARTIFKDQEFEIETRQYP